MQTRTHAHTIVSRRAHPHTSNTIYTIPIKYSNLFAVCPTATATAAGREHNEMRTFLSGADFWSAERAVPQINVSSLI